MTKNDLIVAIARATKLRQADTRRIVQMVFDGIIDALAGQGRIELRNFGVFEVKHRKARKARNPRTGEEVLVPAKKVVTFKPGLVMREKIR